MTPLVILGYLLAIGGSALGALGAWGTSSRHRHIRHIGFLLWITNSPMLVISLIGVSFGWFEPLSALILAPLNLLYWCTAARGWMNTRPSAIE